MDLTESSQMDRASSLYSLRWLQLKIPARLHAPPLPPVAVRRWKEEQKKMMKNVDETFRKNVESNVFSRKMLIQLFPEKCWLSIFIEKCHNIF
jgi:hypothetical protein